MAEWRVSVTITASGTVEADSLEEALQKAPEAIGEEMLADVGSYDGTPEAWLEGKATRAIEDGKCDAWPEDGE